jgi:hypothetical protein
MCPELCHLLFRKLFLSWVFIIRRSNLCYHDDLGTSLDKVASVDWDILAVEVLATCCEKHCRCHVSLLAGSLRRQISLVFLGELALLVILALTSGHLRGEDTRGNGIDTDLESAGLDFGGEHLVQVNHGSLGGIVVEVALRDAHETGDGRDVDDGTGPAVCTLSRLLEERQEGSAEEERCNDVCSVEVAPVLETNGEISHGNSEIT